MALVAFVRHWEWWQTVRERIRIDRDINGLRCRLVEDMPSLWDQHSLLLDTVASDAMELALDVRCLDRIWAESIPRYHIPKIWSNESVIDLY